MHKLEIKLKQHTPLIHFQHDQEGATLRASEVKPKLDKYLIENDFGNDFEKCKRYLIGYSPDPQTIKTLKEKFDKGYRALNYKLRIISENIKDSIRLQSEMRMNDGQRKFYSYWKRFDNGKTEDFPLILSNMGGKEKEGDLLNFSFFEKISMTVSSSEKEICDSIAYYIDLFFAFTNFGQRSTKGFGSFTVIKVDDEIKEFPHEEFNEEPYMEYRLTDEINMTSFCRLFQTIDFYWKCLKSGINYTRNGQYPERYIKAYLWNYLNENEQTWEKRIIKEYFELTTGKEKSENPHIASFARALLGCPDKFEYKNKSKTISIKHAEDPRSESFIARIPSPIIFKPTIEREGRETKIRIYLILDYRPVRKLRLVNNLNFEFSCGNNSMLLQVNPDIIKIKGLIKQYHSYIKKNNWGEKAFYRRVREYNEFVDKFELKNESWFIPLDFNWRKILNTPVILK